MAQQTEAERLGTAWRALSGEEAGEGWRTIAIKLNSPCRLLAGRHFPGDREAILVGFSCIRMPLSHLPRGHGFEVSRVSNDLLGGKRSWLALARRDGGDLDLFVRMAGDVVGLLESCASEGEERLYRFFLARIHAWQQFMERGRSGILSNEAEVGLVGEIVVLMDLLKLGMPSRTALDAWQGPLDGIQDFMIGAGAIEVKTTLSPKGFPATVNSLDQFDETLRHPLFVAGVRLGLGSTGRTLPEMVTEICSLLLEDATDLATFEVRLGHAGYLQAMADRYIRRFVHADTLILPVGGEFPRLTRLNTGPGIRAARYEVDLDTVSGTDVGIIHALENLGGL